MPDVIEYDTEVLFHLEPVQQPDPPLPTRWWTGRGTLQIDVGDGNGQSSWQGGGFGSTQVMGVSAIDASADGIPQRMSISIGIDETQDDTQHAVTAQDLGPVKTTMFFVYRETGTETWTVMSDGTDPKVIRGRSAQSTFKGGAWSFEIENRVHDADRLVVDIWSDAVQQGRHTGDRFFEFTASIEAGLDIDWP